MATNSISTLRLMGMSSGLDTQSIIDNMVKIEQMKIDSQLRKQTSLKWKQESLTSVKNDISSFQLSFLKTTGANSMLKTSTYNPLKVTLSGAKSSAVSISATGSAAVGSYTINRVHQLAAGATAASGGDDKAKGVSSDGKGLSTSSKLSELSTAVGLQFEGAEEARYGEIDRAAYDVLVEAVANDENLGDADIEAYKTANYYVKNADGSYEKYDSDKHSDLELDDLYQMTEPAKPGEISFSINGTDFTFTENDTLSSMMTKINSSDAGVTMSYSAISDKFTIATKELGAHTSLAITNGRGNAFGAGGAFDIDEGTYEGKNAKVEIDGYMVERSTNSFTVDGLSITLNRTTEDGDEETTALVSRDIDSAVDNIKKFVDSYNTLISKLEGLLKERKSSTESSYTPLTEEEKADLSESEIEKWEAIAKKGLLYNDSSLKSMISDLRATLYENVSAAGLSPSQIGLGTGSFFGGTGGQISLDEDKLRAALEKDPNQVQNLFMNITDGKGTGLIYKMDDIMKSYISNGSTNSLDSLEKSLTSLSDKIFNMQMKLETYQERLYKKYAALETAMSELNSQSNWFASLTGG